MRSRRWVRRRRWLLVSVVLPVVGFLAREVYTVALAPRMPWAKTTPTTQTTPPVPPAPPAVTQNPRPDPVVPDPEPEPRRVIFDD